MSKYGNGKEKSIIKNLKTQKERAKLSKCKKCKKKREGHIVINTTVLTLAEYFSTYEIGKKKKYCVDCSIEEAKGEGESE